MTISQPKIDLAVLYKLHQHAEAGGGAIPPVDVLRLFEIDLPLRRIELALDALDARQDVERKYEHFYLDEGAWEISRDGMIKVDRALRVPTSFIGRLHENGDHWLDSQEAQKAVLKRLGDVQSTEPSPQIAVDSDAASGSTLDWTKWGTIIGGISLVVAILALTI